MFLWGLLNGVFQRWDFIENGGIWNPTVENEMPRWDLKCHDGIWFSTVGFPPCLPSFQTSINKVSTKGGRPKAAPPFVEAAEGRLPLWMGLAGVQASSTKHQASSIKLLGYEAMRLGVAHTIFFWGCMEYQGNISFFPFLWSMDFPWIFHGFPIEFSIVFPGFSIVFLGFFCGFLKKLSQKLKNHSLMGLMAS